MKRRGSRRGKWRQRLALRAEILRIHKLAGLRLVTFGARETVHLSLRLTRTGLRLEPAVIIGVTAHHPVMAAITKAGLVNRERQRQWEILPGPLTARITEPLRRRTSEPIRRLQKVNYSPPLAGEENFSKKSASTEGSSWHARMYASLIVCI